MFSTVGRIIVTAMVAPSLLGAQPFPLAFGSPVVVGESEALGHPIDAAVGPDGSLYVLDYMNQQVLKYGADGTLRWRVGRKGSGPGEYQVPIRIVPMPDGSVLVYDLASRVLSRLAANGSYVESATLSPQFAKIDNDNIVALPDGSLAIAGVVNEPSLRDFAAHVFGPDFKHRRSFGPVPYFRNPTLLPLWGVGTVSVSRAGELVFTRRHPYEIHRYAADGSLRQVIRSSLRLVGTPDDAYRVADRQEGRVTTSVGSAVTRIRRTHELRNGWLLSGRTGPEERTFDLFTADGQLAGVHSRLPSNWDSIADYDPIRNVLWVHGTQDDQPVLFRVPLTGSPSR